VRGIVLATCPDLADLGADAATTRLKARLADARKVSTQRETLGAQINAAERKCAELSAVRGRTEISLAEIAIKTGWAADDLPRLEMLLAQREGLLGEMRGPRSAIAIEGLQESALRADLSDYDPDVAVADLDRLDALQTEIEHKRDATIRDLAALEQELAEKQEGYAAEVALFQKNSAQTDMMSAARDWAVLSLGAHLIGEALERQRTMRQGPMMKRGGEILAVLTDGAFAGLGQEFDDDETPHLLGQRRDGRGVRVSEMSEGTRDQLYLALRLAYVEDYATRAEAPPFLADDLFSSFDDRRTASGLRALAGLGASVQTVLFTHHQFLVDTARREIEDVDVIELA
jgi:uncharacterized protein YhaN